MKTQNPIRLFTALLFLMLTFAVNAQTQYEFAVVDFDTYNHLLQISINGETFREEKIDKREVKGRGDVNAALKEVRKMNKEGWEVFQANTLAGSAVDIKAYVFYLRRIIEQE